VEKKKILIADDELGVQEALRLLLAKYQWDIDTAGDGANARELIKRKRYNFLFLDFNMPEVTGIELVKEIKAESPESIVVIITGYNDLDENFSITVGADEYIKKPFSAKEIEEIIVKYSGG